MRNKGFEPLEEYKDAHEPWECRCIKCGRPVTPTYTTARLGHGCAWCANLRVHPDEAVDLMIEAGLQPIGPYTNADDAWLCRCLTCGHEVAPSYTTVRAGGGCRYCNSGGFDYDEPAAVYLISNLGYQAVKVGVASSVSRSDRVEEHRKQGWQLIQSWEIPTGDHAFNVEQAVIGWWRGDLGAPQAMMPVDMPQGGWTETAAMVHVDIGETIERIQLEVDGLAVDTPVDPS